MRRVIAGLALLAGTAAGATLPRVERIAFPTRALRGEETLMVYLPPSYGTSDRTYPALYFLHDAFGSASILERRGAIALLDSAMRRGEISEFVLVAPDGDGSWFSNSHDGRRRYEDLVTVDLPRQIEQRYRVDPRAALRGITGISMGGYGAVKIALKHPELYGSVSSLSGALFPMGWEDVELVFFLARRQLHSVFGKSAADNSLAENDLWRILEGRRVSVPFEVYLLAGTQDKYRLDRVAAQYAGYLNRHGVRTTAKLEPGIHDWPYWRKAFLDIAKWHASKFAGAVTGR
jgi:S-formylglutathione hydrolase FrmB